MVRVISTQTRHNGHVVYKASPVARGGSLERQATDHERYLKQLERQRRYRAKKARRKKVPEE